MIHFYMLDKQYILLNRCGEAIGHLYITLMEEPRYKVGTLKDRNNKTRMLAFSEMCEDVSIAFALIGKNENKEHLSILPLRGERASDIF